MSGRTISAYTDKETAERVAYLAKIEDRNQGQIAASALRLYINLPMEAHQALRRIEATGSPEIQKRLQQGITRLLLDAVYETAHAEIMAQMPLPTAETEEELMNEAVRLDKKYQ